ncbi:MAG: hypothetical protein P4M08_13030 [Oligoflexia bacterium]|nr:hypothetical protein [Oligoflexia bacterium]
MKRIRQVAAYVAVPLGLVAVLDSGWQSAFAQTTGTSTAGTTSIPQFNTNSVQFSAQGLANIANVFGSCVSSAASGLGSIVSTTSSSSLPSSIAGAASGLLGSGSCSGSDQVPQNNDNGEACTMARNNPSYFTNMINQGQQVQSTINCKLKEFSALQSQMQCMQTQANGLQSQIQALSQNLQTNITKQETDVATIDAVVTDRTQQQQQVQSRLGTAGSNGSSGLLGVQAQLSQELSQWTTAIQQQQAAVTGFQQARLQLQTSVNQRTMQLTSQCFSSTPNPAFQCAPNGPPVSAQAYALCRVGQNQFLTATGTISNTSTSQAASQAAQQGLQAVLSSILSDTATFQGQVTAMSATQSDPNSLVAPQESTDIISSPNDIETLFGSQLMSFNTSRLNVHDFIMSQFRNCYNSEVNAVNVEETTPGSALYNQAQAIKTSEAAAKATVDQELQDMVNAEAGAQAALTLTSTPKATAQCTSATLENEMSCITSEQAILRGLLTGNTTNSQMTITIPSNDTMAGSSPISFTCNGINGCVTAYEAVNQNLTNEINRLGSEKKSYITQANAQTQNYLNTIENALSPQSQNIQTMMQNLNSKLAGLGVAPINMQTYSSTPLTKDSDGLYQMPSDLLATVGGALTPPLLQLSGNDFTSGLGSIANSEQQEQSNSGQIASYLQGIQAEQAQCQDMNQQNMLSSLGSQAGNINNCVTQDMSLCSDSVLSSDFSSLNNYLQQQANNPNANNSFSSSGLDSGIQLNCSGSGNLSTVQAACGSRLSNGLGVQKIATGCDSSGGGGGGGDQCCQLVAQYNQSVASSGAGLGQGMANSGTMNCGSLVTSFKNHMQQYNNQYGDSSSGDSAQ